MELVEESSKAASVRLRRVRGQIDGILGMIEEGRDCADVATQISAASKALQRAGFAVILSGLEQCLVADEDGELDEESRQRLERLFLSMA